MLQAKRYIELQRRTGRNNDSLDSSHQAAFYLLSGDADTCEVAKGFISHEGIDFEGLIDESQYHDFSETQHQLLDIAFNLFSWTSETEVTPYDISQMGYPYMELVCNAIYIASGGYEVRVRTLERNRPAIVLDTSRHENSQRIFAELYSFTNRPAIRDDAR